MPNVNEVLIRWIICILHTSFLVEFFVSDSWVWEKKSVSTVFLLRNWEFASTILNFLGMTPAWNQARDLALKLDILPPSYFIDWPLCSFPVKSVSFERDTECCLTIKTTENFLTFWWMLESDTELNLIGFIHKDVRTCVYVRVYMLLMVRSPVQWRLIPACLFPSPARVPLNGFENLTREIYLSISKHTGSDKHVIFKAKICHRWALGKDHF